MNNTTSIVSKVWNFCHTLRDDGVSYGEYLEQLTYLLFLKMADEYAKSPYNRKSNIPKAYNWESLSAKKGAELEEHYVKLLRELGQKSGMLGQIFFKAQNRIQDPAKLFKIIDMIDRENWVMMGADVKGEIYEGLLEKNAEDVKSGAGQYFTPRPLIRAMVECLRPEPKKTIADPACGTGGFFLAAYDFLVGTNVVGAHGAVGADGVGTDGGVGAHGVGAHSGDGAHGGDGAHSGDGAHGGAPLRLDKQEKEFLKFKTFRGWEIVPDTYRLCLMNLFLHNIGDMDSEPPIMRNDSLIAKPNDNFDCVMTNPPFGKKSSMTFTNEEGEQERDDLTYNRQDFWATTSNKQLNFVQHIRTMLKPDGKAAVVVPDNVLFEGGAGETIRKKLLASTDLHTILRLPTGIFYAQGVKANVIFFDNRPGSKEVATKEVWYYDYRTNVHHTKKKDPLQFEDLQDFVKCYNPENRHKRKQTWSEKNPEGRWRKFTYDEIIARDKTSLDIFWLKDESLADLDNLPDPDVLAGEIVENLEAGLESFREIVDKLAEA